MLNYRLSNSPIFLISRAHRRLAAKFEEAMEGELTAPQFLLLAALSRLGRANQLELVRASGIDRSTVSVMLYLLAQKGLVRSRAVKGDRRQREAQLTEAGLEAVKRGVLVERALAQELADSASGGYLKLIASLMKVASYE